MVYNVLIEMTKISKEYWRTLDTLRTEQVTAVRCGQVPIIKCCESPFKNLLH